MPAVDGAMSSIDQAVGGALVGHPTRCKCIECRRNKAALIRKQLHRRGHKDYHREPGYSYKYATTDGGDAYGLDLALEPTDVIVDEGRFSITIPFAASHGRDRTGDFVEVEGIETTHHQWLPAAFLDHGRNYALPIGKCEDPDGGYTVKILPERGIALAEIFLDKSELSIIPRQIFELYRQRILRAGSIGYRPLEATILPPEPAKGIFKKGLWLKRTELLEVSVVGLPMNGDAVRKALESQWCGKSLAGPLGAMLEPHASRKSWSHGVTIMPTPKPGESRSDYVKRCVPEVIREGLTEEQAVGKCEGMFDSHHKKDLGPDAAAGTAGADERIPHGAQALGDLHEAIGIVKSVIEHHHPMLEHEKVKTLFEKHYKALDGMGDACAKAFEEHYPDLEPLQDESGDADGKGIAEHANKGTPPETPPPATPPADPAPSAPVVAAGTIHRTLKRRLVPVGGGKGLATDEPDEAAALLVMLDRLDRRLNASEENLRKAMGQG